MAGKEAGTAKSLERFPVEQMKGKVDVPEAVHTGTCIQMGWRRGKEVTCKEYLAAVEGFKSSAAGRRGHA